MAVAPRDFTAITRDQVNTWLGTYRKSKRNVSLRDYIASRIAKLKLPDDQVNTSGHENLEDTTHLADLIMMDLPSYPNGKRLL
jgi:hypothetical protein